MEPKQVALAYIEACAKKDWKTVEGLLAKDVHFLGPNNDVRGAEPYLAVLRRLGLVWVRSEVKQVFADEAEVCVIYDFVTNTPAKSVPIVEWLTVRDGRISRVFLVFDRVSFKPASDELQKRLQPPT